MEHLELDADRALFEGKLEGIIAVVYQNERPLAGLAGLLDWRFQGAISNCIRAGAMSGAEGECTYLPVSKNGKTYHLLLLGGGHLGPSGRKGSPAPLAALDRVRANAISLRLSSIGVSRSDFGGAGDDFFEKHFKGATLWIIP